MNKSKPTHDKREPVKERQSIGDQPPALTIEGRRRVVIEHVQPEIDGGRYPIKRVLGDTVTVSADLFADGHDVVGGSLRFRREEQDTWQEVPLTFVTNDRWQAGFQVTELGRYRYTVMGWIDHFATWQHDMRKRLEADQDVRVDLQIGTRLIEEAAGRAKGEAGQRLHSIR
ncbi:MAG TPA: maltotransferase domain-containing protein, partial [Nitrospiraceae bacterium]|nr:maltotransferase domain-containing protein [Nitrospiraceae bacterium]